MQETQVQSLGQEDPPENRMATHSSILAWEIPWTEKPGGLQFMGWQRIRHDWATKHIHTHTHTHTHRVIWDFPEASGEESACQCRRLNRCGFSPLVGKIPWRRKWQPSPVFLPGEPHGQRCMVGYSPWGHKELDTTEHVWMLTYKNLQFPVLDLEINNQIK